jgi:hypothetical protein
LIFRATFPTAHHTDRIDVEEDRGRADVFRRQKTVAVPNGNSRVWT